jgi:hypothetical protein
MIVLKTIESLSLGTLYKGQEIEIEDKEVESELLKLGYIGEVTAHEIPKGATKAKGSDKQVSPKDNS